MQLSRTPPHPTTFTAAVLTKLGEPLEIIEGIEIPELRNGQVLVRVFYTGVCHSQVMEARGRRGEDPYLPHMMGHEGSGEVIATGVGVSKINVGDRVVLGWIKGKGIEAGGAKFIGPDRQTINAGGVTTFSEYSIVSENRLVKLPPHTDLRSAVLYGCAMPTGAGIIFNEISPEQGSTIAIVGLGGIGISALMAAKTTKPSILIAIDIEDAKLKLASDLGATHIINSQASNAVAEVHNIVSTGLDYAVEASGKANMIEQAFEMIRRGGGDLVFASHPQEGDKISIDPFELICGKSIRGSWGGGGQTGY